MMGFGVRIDEVRKKFLWVIGCVLMLWGIPLSGQQSVAPEIPESAVRMTKVSGQVVDENTAWLRHYKIIDFVIAW